MQGSKYSDDLREKAIAMCAMPKYNPSKVAKELGVPRATVYDWYRTSQANDPDLIAIRRNKLRNLMDKSYSIATRTIDSLDKHSKILKMNNDNLNKIIEKLENDNQIDDKMKKQMQEIIKNYAGVGIIDTVKVLKESIAISEKFENALDGDKSNTDTNIRIYFADEN